MAFLVFEGLDGSGKTTLIARLEAELVRRTIRVVVTREPGGSELGDEIRHLLLRTNAQAPTPRCELLLYQAVRAQHVDLLIRPQLEKKTWVLCDRFTSSSVAFQSQGRALEMDDVDWLNRFSTGGLKPHLTILLDLSVEESDRRRRDRTATTGIAQDRFESETKDFHARVRESYLQQAAKAPAEWLVVSAAQTPEQIFKTVLDHLESQPWFQ